ncbi:hypothetical protein [Paenibacillus sp. GYB003]|uniref:hypothetical protein n=1 Tax=Paenibacillus sp. GYB003 TaxID=2994392 RepID=UPI002F966173
MILYRLAKWMEERKRLKRLIAEGGKDRSRYIEQKEKVERQMLREAHFWLEPRKAAPVPAAVLFAADEPEPQRGEAESGLVEERHDLPDLAELLESVRRSVWQAQPGPLERAVSRHGVPLRAEELIPEELLRMPLIAEEPIHAPQP